MEGVDAYRLTQHLKSTVDDTKHREIERLYLSYVSDARPSNQQHVVRELQNLVGPEKLHEAVEASLSMPGQVDANGSAVRPGHTNGVNMHDREDASEYEADESESEAVSKNLKGANSSSSSSSSNAAAGNVEICEATLQAWNHCVECKRGPACKRELCKGLRPYVVHLRQKRSEGVVGVCLESCKFCNFFDTLKRRVVPHEEQMSSRKRKEAAKAKRLVQQFTGLLLAHSSERGDPIMRSLYNHVMQCVEENCNFRVEYGSCRSSRALMFHLQDCRADQTKSCELCSKLPPHVWRMKKKRRSLPKPAFVVKCIEEERKKRQRERRRQRSTNKRTAASISDSDPANAESDAATAAIGAAGSSAVAPNLSSHSASASSEAALSLHTYSESPFGTSETATRSSPSGAVMYGDNAGALPAPSHSNHLVGGEPFAPSLQNAIISTSPPPAPSLSAFGADHTDPLRQSEPIFSSSQDFEGGPVFSTANSDGAYLGEPSAPNGMSFGRRSTNGEMMPGDISMLSLADTDHMTPLGKRKPDELYLPGHFDKRGRSDR
ncbi:Hypothetical Protein FCC1311_053912 [Hondaea fermentalgiana]|uniref:Uncharacterized protein n=1 Tax=Hondaea fermentalgiana TaxID=2315210 RepID=A0A2R5GFS7_9STRA|nr:Hypothetical Protein FCC1311_053912 [Hondaea fermentalgiana]|eukprot:GBG29169.1 Hypothetical Protein FCC1311_053912 [Hondaea fermentalgiana]